MGLTTGIKDAFVSGASDIWETIKNDGGDMLLHLADTMQEGITKLMQELIDLVLTTPLVGDNPIVVKLWIFVRLISFSLIGLMFVWEGFKKVLSPENIMRAADFKNLFIRMIFGVIMAVFSLDLVDIIIQFNNAIVETLRANFEMAVSQQLNIEGAWNYVMTLALLVVQLVLGVKVAIQYFMRLGEIWLMAILGPLAWTSWINQSGIMAGWTRRLATVIFTQTFWALILVLYTAMVGAVSLAGGVWNMCMSIALLLIMLETPAYLRQFIGSHENPIQLLNKARRNTMSKVKNIANVKGKVAGWFKPKAN